MRDTTSPETARAISVERSTWKAKLMAIEQKWKIARRSRTETNHGGSGVVVVVRGGKR
ncbi:hypothetical protein RUND412_009510, partial [Rhizina undulata]